MRARNCARRVLLSTAAGQRFPTLVRLVGRAGDRCRQHRAGLPGSPTDGATLRYTVSLARTERSGSGDQRYRGFLGRERILGGPAATHGGTGPRRAAGSGCSSTSSCPCIVKQARGVCDRASEHHSGPAAGPSVARRSRTPSNPSRTRVLATRFLEATHAPVHERAVPWASRLGGEKVIVTPTARRPEAPGRCGCAGSRVRVNDLRQTP